MALKITDITTIKNWFKTGLKPTQTQFWSTWDSFWHKSESLPISSISGLGALIDGKAEENHEHNQYATNDATSLTADNVTAWQQKLGVADLKFDDKAITITQDYTDFGLVAGDSINAFNNAIYTEVAKKLDAPTEEGTTTDYPYVVGVNNENEPIKLPAGDLGKNFSNTDLEITENRKHTGTASLELAMPMIYSNASQRFPGLVDKSADATYNSFPVLDENGNAAKAAKPFHAFKNFLTQCTIAESTELGQLLNGGQGDSGAISVNLISPPIVQNRFDSVEYILLRGANLLLNSTDMSISICDENKNVIQQIPNNQIINQSSTELIFYYNFYQFNAGAYFIKISSGVKVYYTTLDLRVVQEIQDIDTDNLAWNILYDSSVTPNIDDVAQGRGVSIFSPLGDSPNIKVSAKSSELFAQGEDFYLEFEATVGFKTNAAQNFLQRSYFGLGYSSTPNSLLQNCLLHTSYNFRSGVRVNTFLMSSLIQESADTPTRLNVIIIKVGNLFRISIGNNIQSVTLSNNSGYSLFIQATGRVAQNTNEIQIIKAFKFN